MGKGDIYALLNLLGKSEPDKTAITIDTHYVVWIYEPKVAAGESRWQVLTPKSIFKKQAGNRDKSPQADYSGFQPQKAPISLRRETKHDNNENFLYWKNRQIELGISDLILLAGQGAGHNISLQLLIMSQGFFGQDAWQ